MVIQLERGRSADGVSADDWTAPFRRCRAPGAFRDENAPNAMDSSRASLPHSAPWAAALNSARPTLRDGQNYPAFGRRSTKVPPFEAGHRAYENRAVPAPVRTMGGTRLAQPAAHGRRAHGAALLAPSEGYFFTASGPTYLPRDAFEEPPLTGKSASGYGTDAHFQSREQDPLRLQRTGDFNVSRAAVRPASEPAPPTRGHGQDAAPHGSDSWQPFIDVARDGTVGWSPYAPPGESAAYAGEIGRFGAPGGLRRPSYSASSYRRPVRHLRPRTRPGVFPSSQGLFPQNDGVAETKEAYPGTSRGAETTAIAHGSYAKVQGASRLSAFHAGDGGSWAGAGFEPPRRSRSGSASSLRTKNEGEAHLAHHGEVSRPENRVGDGQREGWPGATPGPDGYGFRRPRGEHVQADERSQVAERETSRPPVYANRSHLSSQRVAAYTSQQDWDEAQESSHDGHLRSTYSQPGSISSSSGDQPPRSALNREEKQVILPANDLDTGNQYNPAESERQEASKRFDELPVVLHSSGAAPSGPAEAVAEEEPLVACSVCGRRFAQSRINKHITICRKAVIKEEKRQKKKFDPTKHRWSGTENAPAAMQQSAAASRSAALSKHRKPVPKWKAQRAQLRAALRATKGDSSTAGSGYGGDDSLPADEDLQDTRVACPHCGRKFADTAAERHIPICASKNARMASSSSTATSKAAAALQRRKAYGKRVR